jgi:hypothetical protein
MFHSSDVLSLEPGDQVKNVEGTGSQRPLGGGSWKKKYLEDVPNWPERCCIKDCTEPADGSGHVYIKSKGYNVYIIPMCDRKHNTAHNKDWLYVENDTKALLINRETRVPVSSDNETHDLDNDNGFLPWWCVIV